MKSRVLTLVLGSLAIAATGSANLVVNHSFEAPNQGGGWGYSNDDGIVAWYAESGLMEVGSAGTYGVSGQDANQVLELDAKVNAKVSQLLVTSATAYTLSFGAALRANVALASQGVDVYWNDALVGSVLPGSTVMSSHSFVVNGTGAIDKLSFVGTGTSDSFGTVIDNVSVEAVPEPGTMAALAFGAAAMARRRRKA